VGRVSRAAVFLDRDGTINARPPAHEYLTSVEQFAWLPGAVEALVRLARSGFVLAVVSNQRGIARGSVSDRALSEIERVIQDELHARGCRITAFRYCPHELEQRCRCRKPEPGLILELADELKLDLGSSWMVGDSESDVLAGRAAGCRTALLAPAADGVRADLVASSLLEASRRIAASPPVG
jgi:D-glycero-D-manno-heptose 1,7-bisphosphate phosphatase